MPEFHKVLVANRGEIAVRVIRTARALGYRTVAVYSDADRGAQHRALADEAVAIGQAASAESYLAIDRIIAAARRCGADAIHPGYGFLSENADFAEACAAAGIAFVGPTAQAVRLMGNKAAAKRRMSAAGVPCVPGYDGEDQDDATLARAAAEIGFPIMIKAAAGGGGKGMRLVTDRSDFAGALGAARSEAQKAFGSPKLILERAIAPARHVEIQVFGDQHGNVIHLGERDCSIQRRHQKIIEETPAPGLTAALRNQMGETAVAAARAIGYVGAGTIEFLLAPGGAFYFLEMNTRLQVEHPVTEMVTGFDLVAWQLRIASGDPLPLRQAEVAATGHAIEARLCAEDAYGDFLPDAGAVLAFEPPTGPGIRVDHALIAGISMSPYYDPMMAKVIAHGASREEARRRLVAALENLVVFGVETNRGFLIDCLSGPAFAAAELSTTFVETHFPPSRRVRAAPGPDLWALAAVLIDRRSGPSVAPAAHPWRSTGTSLSRLRLASADHEAATEVVRLGDERFRVEWADQIRDVEIVAIRGSRVRFVAGEVERTAQFAFDRDQLHLGLGTVTATFEDMLLAPSNAAENAGHGAAVAPMTGLIAAVRVKTGDPVKKGQCLVILEAMKMEHEIGAPRDGVIAAVLVVVGEQVPTRKVLVELAPP